MSDGFPNKTFCTSKLVDLFCQLLRPIVIEMDRLEAKDSVRDGILCREPAHHRQEKGNGETHSPEAQYRRRPDDRFELVCCSHLVIVSFKLSNTFATAVIAAS